MACFDRCAHRRTSAPSAFRRMALPRDSRALSNMLSCAARCWGMIRSDFEKTKQDYLAGHRLNYGHLNGCSSRTIAQSLACLTIISRLRCIVEDPMTEAEKRLREYLAKIGRRGGLAGRRELTRSHAKQMVAIREAKRAALKAGRPWPPRNRKALKVS